MFPEYGIVILPEWVKLPLLFAPFSLAALQHPQPSSPAQLHESAQRSLVLLQRKEPLPVQLQHKNLPGDDLSRHNLLTSLKYLHFMEAPFLTIEKLSQICVYQHLLWVLLRISCSRPMDSPGTQPHSGAGSLQESTSTLCCCPTAVLDETSSSRLLSKRSVKQLWYHLKEAYSNLCLSGHCTTTNPNSSHETSGRKATVTPTEISSRSSSFP